MATQKTTVDENEIQIFSARVDQWWDKKNLLHLMNQKRVPAIQNVLLKAGQINPKYAQTTKPLTGLRILDVGCGGGILSEPLAELGATVTGLDASKELIECAKLHASTKKDIVNNLTYVTDMIEEFCEKNYEKFDAVVASEVVEHVDSVDYFLEACVKSLKPGGSIFITTINRTTRSWLKAIILYEYIYRIIPRGTHNWYKFVTPEELENVLQNNKCKKTHLEGWQFNYLTSTFNFSPDVSVFYYMHAIKNE